MSLRDEMKKASKDMLDMYGDRLATIKGRVRASENLTEALMPLVERAVREAIKQSLYQAMSNTPWGEEPKATDDWVAPILARVLRPK